MGGTAPGRWGKAIPVTGSLNYWGGEPRDPGGVLQLSSLPKAGRTGETLTTWTQQWGHNVEMVSMRIVLPGTEQKDPGVTGCGEVWVSVLGVVGW